MWTFTRSNLRRFGSKDLFALAISSVLAGLWGAAFLAAQAPTVVASAPEQQITDQLRGLRRLPDDTRANTTRQLAFAIRRLPPSRVKLRLAIGLAYRSTEGDFGHDNLVELLGHVVSALPQGNARP